MENRGPGARLSHQYRNLLRTLSTLMTSRMTIGQCALLCLLCWFLSLVLAKENSCPRWHKIITIMVPISMLTISSKYFICYLVMPLSIRAALTPSTLGLPVSNGCQRSIWVMFPLQKKFLNFCSGPSLLLQACNKVLRHRYKFR